MRHSDPARPFRELTNVCAGAQATLQRFWKTVGIEAQADKSGGEHLAVTLDKRPLKTPSGNPLVLPREKTLTATLVAAEWDNQETLLKQHSLPMVRGWL